MKRRAPEPKLCHFYDGTAALISMITAHNQLSLHLPKDKKCLTVNFAPLL